jgi:hypothetical protein
MEAAMTERIQEGFDVFVHDGEKAFAAVRQVHAHEIIIYVENGGDFRVPMGAVKDVHDEKVILDSGRLESDLKEAIRRAHSVEDPRIP